MITNTERFAEQMARLKARAGQNDLIDYCCLLAFVFLATAALLAGVGLGEFASGFSSIVSAVVSRILSAAQYWALPGGH